MQMSAPTTRSSSNQPPNPPPAPTKQEPPPAPAKPPGSPAPSKPPGSPAKEPPHAPAKPPGAPAKEPAHVHAEPAPLPAGIMDAATVLQLFNQQNFNTMQAFQHNVQAITDAQREQFNTAMLAMREDMRAQREQARADQTAARQAMQAHLDAMALGIVQQGQHVQTAIQDTTNVVQNAPPPPPPLPQRPREVRAPPAPPKYDIPKFDSSEQDPVLLAIKYRAFRKDAENVAHQYAQTLAYHFRSQVQEMSVGTAGTDRFQDEDRRTGFATMIFREVQRIASQCRAQNPRGFKGNPSPVNHSIRVADLRSDRCWI